MAVIGGLIDGRLPTIQEILDQVSGAVQENISLVQAQQPGVAFDRFAALRPPRREPNPFLDSVIPEVAGNGVGGDKFHEGYKADRDRCRCRKKCLTTTKRTFIPLLTSNPEQVLGSNPNRMAVTFVGFSAVTYMVGWTTWLGSADDPSHIWDGPGGLQLLEKDYGTAIGQPFFAANQSGGSVRLTITELLVI